MMLWRNDDPWWDHALCLELGTELFYADDDDPSHSWATYMVAKEACAMCPVRTECLEFAMKAEEETSQKHRYGVWGGLTPPERRRLATTRQTEREERRAS